MPAPRTAPPTAADVDGAVDANVDPTVGGVPPPAPPSRVSRPALALLAFAGFLLLLATRPPLGSEVRYLLSAREMAEGGDWVVPHLLHVPYMEKPPLLYWAAAAGRVLFGASDVALRMPSILAGLAIVATTYALARRLRGPRFALGAAAMTATSLLVAVLSAVLMTDALFAGWLAVAWYAQWRHREDPRGRWIWAFWAALGLAVLTKGLLALGFVGVSTLTYLALTRRLSDVRGMRPFLGAAIVAAIQVPWTVLVALRDPRLVEFYYVRQNLGAFASADVNHDRSPLYYLRWLVACAFPWSALLVATLPSAVVRTAKTAWRARSAGLPAAPGSAEDLRVWLLSVAVPSFALLTAAGSKLATYLLPILPAILLLVADRAAEAVAAGRLRFRHAFLVQGGLLAAAAAALPFVLPRLAPERLLGFDPAWTAAPAAGLALLALGCLVAWRALGRGLTATAVWTVGGTAAVALAAASFAAPRLAPSLDGGPMIARMEAARRPGEEVVVAGRMSQDLTALARLRERPTFLGTPGELGMGHFVECTSPADPIPSDPNHVSRTLCPQNRWLIEEPDLLAKWDGPGRVWFVTRDLDLKLLRAAGKPFHVFAADARRAVVTNLPLGPP